MNHDVYILSFMMYFDHTSCVPVALHMGPEREDVSGGWTRLHNGELHNLDALPS
jgi:hypothetical protein